MRLGLWLCAPEDALLRAQACRLTDFLDLPLCGFVTEPSPRFDGADGRTAFLCRAAGAIYRGESIPAALILRHLIDDAAPANVLRRHLEWQTALRLYLAGVDAPVDGEGFFRLGKDLIVCPLSDEGAADALLPTGQWTDMVTGEVVEGRFRRMRSPNAVPLLAAQGSVIPTGDEAYPTLHWYQPPENAMGLFHPDPCHLILHRDGVETCLR